MKNIGLLICLCAPLSGCSGGNGSSPEQDVTREIPAGMYSATLHGSETGELMQGMDGFAVYSTRTSMAYGTWTYTSSDASISLTSLSHPVDDLGNEFPSAKSSNRTEDFRVTQSGDNWSGQDLALTPNTRASAPTISSIPGNWRFRNLYRFGSEYLDYEMHIDIDAAGTLSGFDTNDCRFTGSLSELGGGSSLYRIAIQSSQCGATSLYIENHSYTGYGYLRQFDSQPRLAIVAVNSASATGISVDLWEAGASISAPTLPCRPQRDGTCR
jgi:hypothetical protein